MSELLYQYQKVNPISWAYLSSFLMIALYFKFNRFWSVRNLDLVLMILLAPGLLLVQSGRQRMAQAELTARQTAAQPAAVDKNHEPPPNLADAPPSEISGQPMPPAAEKPPLEKQPLLAKGKAIAWRGYVWLFAVSALWLVRMLFDPTMVRRPLLEPNLTNGGLLFIGCSLFIFLMANVVVSDVAVEDLAGPAGARAILMGADSSQTDAPVEDYTQRGPGYYALHLLPGIITTPYAIPDDQPDQKNLGFVAAAKVMAILSHFAVVSAMIFIGYWHFENVKMGIGAATIYLLLPYTAQMTGHVDHVLPAALLLWAIVLYRRPALAGALIGLAMSVFYYPFFLLPLWLSFYWQRGVTRFVSGLLTALGLMVISLLFVSSDLHSFWAKIQPMFGLWVPKTAGLSGVWALGWDPAYRLPVIVTCVILGGSMALWPAQKNLGTLLSCSAAIMIAIQFWHGHGFGGGMYLAWYMPLLLLTVFRPNLEDRVALTVLGEDWFTRRRARLAQFERAA